MFAYIYPQASVFWTMVDFFLFLIWFTLLIVVFGDIFRSNDLGGWAKALWVTFVIVIPFLGILVYLIARGGKIQERSLEQTQRQQQAFDAGVRQAVGTSGKRRPVGQACRPEGRRSADGRRVPGAEAQGPQRTSPRPHLL